MIVETTCKFCQRPIEMEVDEAGFKNSMIDASLWLKHIACTRCADYQNTKRAIVDSIAKMCMVVQNSRGDGQVLGVMKEKLESKTRELCKLICDFKMASLVWDDSFAAMLMEKPMLFSKIINSYTFNLNRIIETQRAKEEQT